MAQKGQPPRSPSLSSVSAITGCLLMSYPRNTVLILCDEGDGLVAVNILKVLIFLQPYGVNQPGPVIRYQTTDLNGHPQKGTGKAAKLDIFEHKLRLFF